MFQAIQVPWSVPRGLDLRLVAEYPEVREAFAFSRRSSQLAHGRSLFSLGTQPRRRLRCLPGWSAHLRAASRSTSPAAVSFLLESWSAAAPPKDRHKRDSKISSIIMLAGTHVKA